MSTKYLIIAGSTKCGTTSLYKYLTDHPDVSPSKIKETRYFLDEDYPLPISGLVSEANNYDSLFEKKTLIKCESTPDYLYSDNSPYRIKKELGHDAHIFFIFRDPIERFLSWFKHSKQIGALPKNANLHHFIGNQKEQHYSKCQFQYEMALAQGKYSNFLGNWFNEFGAEKITLIDFTDLQNHPKKLINAICTKLDLDKDFYREYIFSQVNKSMFPRSKNLAQCFYIANRKLEPYIPKGPTRSFLSKGKKYLQQLIFSDVYTKNNYNGLPEEELSLLKDYYGSSFIDLSNKFLSLKE